MTHSDDDIPYAKNFFVTGVADLLELCEILVGLIPEFVEAFSELVAILVVGQPWTVVRLDVEDRSEDMEKHLLMFPYSTLGGCFG